MRIGAGWWLRYYGDDGADGADRGWKKSLHLMTMSLGDDWIDSY